MISACETGIKVWNTLIIIYEGTSQVKESKKSIYVHQYDVFKMLVNERVTEMYIIVTDTINNLKSLKKLA